MKFLHISTGDSRGAFSGAYRLHQNLQACGHESLMFVGHKTTNDPTVLAPSVLFQRVRFFLEKLCSQIAKRLFGLDVQVSRIFKPNMAFVPVFEVLGKIREFQPDLVVVYYVADFISEQQILKIQQATRAPVVFYLMDMGMLTGACHYAWDCTGYHNNCGACPITQQGWIRKLIARKWLSRKTAFQKINPLIVSGSAQLSLQVVRSGLVHDFRSEKILIGINSDLYNPQSRQEARQFFGLPEDKLVFYFGAQAVNDKRKGFTYLVDALQILAKTLSPQQLQQVVLFTIGSGDPITQYALPFQHVHLPFIADPHRFSKTYAAADLFICPSVEDSGPMMINESMMSGTPVVAFNLGVARDLVIDGETGFNVAEVGAQGLAQALMRCMVMDQAQRADMRERCRALALQLSSTQTQVQAFVRLAQRLQA